MGNYKILKNVYIYCALLIIVPLATINAAALENVYKTVNTTNGLIRGQKLVTLYEQKSYFSFKGIPYAKAPIAALRFLPPQSMSSWAPNTRDALKHGNICTQFSANFQQLLGSEDCLYLNVYTPAVVTSATALRDVMVFIHGGSFYYGSGNIDLQGPDFLINENVIVVTINYRLGVMGFMSLGTAEYSGNMGLKDQQMAIKWVTTNIHAFGGNPKKITLFGQSAGGASAHFHTLVPSSECLFQRAILISGTALNNWAIQKENTHLKKMEAFAKKTNISDLIKYLQNVNLTPIMKYFQQSIRALEWMPVIENQNAKQAFLQQNPAAILLERQFVTNVDILIGFNSAEGLFYSSSEVNNPKQLESFNKNFYVPFPDRNFNGDYNSAKYKAAAQEIRQFYFGNSGRIDLQNYLNLFSDIFMNYGVDRAAKVISVNSIGSVFYYKFSVDSNFNYFKTIMKETSQRGANHQDEQCYVFRCDINPKMYENIKNESVPMQALKTTTKIWSNFAKSGNPNGAKSWNWKAINKSTINFADITNNGVKIGLSPNSERFIFWKNLLNKYSSLIDNKVEAYVPLEVKQKQNKCKIKDNLTVNKTAVSKSNGTEVKSNNITKAHNQSLKNGTEVKSNNSTKTYNQSLKHGTEIRPNNITKAHNQSLKNGTKVKSNNSTKTYNQFLKNGTEIKSNNITKAFNQSLKYAPKDLTIKQNLTKEMPNDSSCGNCRHKYKIVNTKSGLIQGEQLTTLFKNKLYYSFRGIPYAQAPIGKLRFLPPKPIRPWTNTFEALEHGNVCIQLNGNQVIGSEDCLYLNIYAPAIDSSGSEKLKVMLFIHGGSFFYGSGNIDLQGPDFLINNDVIVVTINYRLNVFGFMSLGIPDYSGNMGLKDQQMAMQWIQQNIHNFGGDSQRITIFGQSAGSVSAHLHTISPSSSGLFKRAILVSGTALNWWAVNKQNSHIAEMYKFANDQKASICSHRELIPYLQAVSGDILLNYFGNTFSSLMWNPVVEHKYARKPFLQKSPEEYLLDVNFVTDVDIMLGFNSAEGLFYSSSEVSNPAALKSFNTNFVVPFPVRSFTNNYQSVDYKKATADIREFYFGKSKTIDIDGYVKLVSDVFMNYGVDRTAKLLGATSMGRTWYYTFSVDTKLNYFKIAMNETSQRGANHQDEQCHIFRCNVNSEMYRSTKNYTNEMTAIKLTTGVWSNFAKYGNPGVGYNSTWQPINRCAVNYVNITNTKLVAGHNPINDRIQFWNNLLKKYSMLMANTYHDEL